MAIRMAIRERVEHSLGEYRLTCEAASGAFFDINVSSTPRGQLNRCANGIGNSATNGTKSRNWPFTLDKPLSYYGTL